MDVKEFLSKYHDYGVATKVECLKEIESMEPVTDERDGVFSYVNIIPVEFPTLGWCLMVDTAYQELKRLKIL